MKLLTLLIALLLITTAVQAKDAAVFMDSRITPAAWTSGLMPPNNCTMQENVTMNISFNGSIEHASAVKSLMDERNQEIADMAKKLGISNIQIQSQNFSINMNYNNHNDHYTYSGNVSMKLSPYEKALELMDQLKEKRYRASLSVNNYANNCQ